MTPLRRRMIDDMQLRNLAPRTIKVYVSRVGTLARHFGRSPEALGPDDVRPEDGQELLVRRYLGAFGPTRAADVARWAGIGNNLIGPSSYRVSAL